MNNASKGVRDGYLVETTDKRLDMLDDISPSARYKKRLARKKKIVKADFVGITVCVLFAIIKFVIGFLSNSLAIESDAMSSLTESYSYIISALGISLAHKKPDKKHPNGYGRLEFLTVIIGSVLVIIAGWHYLESSLGRIFQPQLSAVSTVQLIILGITVLGKLYLFKDDGEVGREVNSAGLITASRNALLSALTSVLVIVSAIVSQYFKIDIDGYVGLIIAALMIITGFIGLKKGVQPLIGAPVKVSTAHEITEILLQHYPVIGVYDLRINNNGAGIVRGTVNAEVPSDANAEEIYEAFRKSRTEIYRRLGIDLTIGLITVNYCDSDIFPMYNPIYNEVIKIDGINNVHGFNYNKDTNEVDLHVTVDFDHLNEEGLEDKVQEIVQKYIPNSSVLVDMNVNYLEDKADPNEGATCAVPIKH